MVLISTDLDDTTVTPLEKLRYSRWSSRWLSNNKTAISQLIDQRSQRNYNGVTPNRGANPTLIGIPYYGVG